ncbi:hypothetical protein BDW22DRAFT_434720 [Trametopsis cervina]|nr:hypothetical protein BDW22DRAFT_434720 [Trametopsis cervina]
MSSAAEIYALELSSRGHGLPLWIPEPTESGEVLIGDVGYVWRGAFYRLFNVTRSRDDPINKNDVPDDFKVLQYAPQARHTINGYVHDALCSRTVRSTGAQAKLSADLAPAGLGYKFTCTADRGAALVMKDAGILEEVHASGSFEEYFKQHHNNWIAFATKIGLTLTLEDFLLVRGCIKTTAWAVAAFMGGNNAHELSFRADAASFANAEFSVSRSVGVDPAIERRVGPLAASSKLFIPGQPAYANGENTSYDQCIFLHALKCKRRLLFNGIRIRAAAEPRDESFTDQFPPTPDSIGWKTSEERFSEEYEFEGSYSVNVGSLIV